MSTSSAPDQPSPVHAFSNALLSNARLYDLVQRVIGGGETVRRLQQELTGLRPAMVIDVGAGTGNRVQQLPDSAKYVWLDIDPEKLRRFRQKWPALCAVMSDANSLAIKDRTSDCTLCVAVTHHLPAAALPGVFREMARITRGSLVFVDALRTPSRLSRALWRLDRGSHPHSEEELIAALSASFRINHVERYARYHHYLLCRATPIEAISEPGEMPLRQRGLHPV